VFASAEQFSHILRNSAQQGGNKEQVCFACVSLCR
jgi:hypothetical protein